MKLLNISILSAILALSLAACNDSDSSVASGSLSINNGSGITIGETVAHAIPVALNGSSGVKAIAVNIASSDNSIATVYPKTCYLSSTSGHHSCLVFLRGKNDGTVSITASAEGYDKASSKVVVNEIVESKPVALSMGAIKAATTPNYGQLQIASFPSANAPSTSNFAMTAQVGDTITLAASITNFDTPLDGVPILLSVTGGASIVGSPQCNADSNYDANHYCLYQVQLPATTGTVTATATAVGNNAVDFSNAPTATITVQNNAVL